MRLQRPLEPERAQSERPDDRRETGFLIDERTASVEKDGRTRRPYVQVAAVAAIALAILSAGLFGKNLSATANASGSPAATPTAVPTSTLAPVAIVATPDPTPAGPLPPLQPAAADVARASLPGGVTGRSIAAIGTRIFFVDGGNRIETNRIGASTAPQTIVTAPACQTIQRIAAAGNVLAYVERISVGFPLDAAGCGTGSTITWSVWMMNLNGGAARQIATGLRDAATPQDAADPIHLALTDSALAFDRPPAPATGWTDETVEIHSVTDGGLLWSTQTDAPVVQLMLGGPELAVLTRGQHLHLWKANASSPDLYLVSLPSTTASIAHDGSYLVWDLNPGSPALAVQAVSTGAEVDMTTDPSARSPQPVQPVVASTAQGPLVAWYLFAGFHDVYPAVRDIAAGRSAALSSVEIPVWIDLQGDLLIWVSANEGGAVSVASAVNLAQTGIAASGPSTPPMNLIGAGVELSEFSAPRTM